MRLRDILIVGVAIAACIFGWSQEGNLNVQRAFTIPITDSEVLQRYLSKPVVVDLQGDGKPFVVASATDGSVSSFPTYVCRGNLENMFLPIQAAKTTAVYGRVVGIGAGKLVSTAPANYVAVVTDDYRVTLLDGNLSRVWDVSVVPSMSSWIPIYHASVLVLSERVYAEDKGCVVVYVKVSGANNTEQELFAALDGGTGTVRWLHSFGKVGTSGGATATHDASQNQNFWLANSTSIKRRGLMLDTSALKTEAAHRPWTYFREAVVAGLPHRYAHPWDVQLRPHVFFHAKNRKKRSTDAKKGSTVKYKDRAVRLVKDDYGVLGDQLRLTKHALRSYFGGDGDQKEGHHEDGVHPNVLIFHSKTGMRVVHLFTGETITEVGPLRTGNVVYHDINDIFQIDAISNVIGPRTDRHSRHGVDLVHDCLGVISSGAPFAEDHLLNVTICDTQGFFGNLDLIHHFVDGDIRGAEAPHTLNTLELLGSRNIVSQSTRGVPPVVAQYRSQRGRGVFQIERNAIFMIDTGLVTCVDPSRRRVLWRAQTGSSFESTRTVEMAEVPAGMFSEEEKENRNRPFPHLALFSLHQVSEDSIGYVGGRRRRYLRTDPYVLALGEARMSVLSTRSGRMVRSVELNSPPSAPAIVADFNGDGTNDIILVTSNAVVGFIVTAKASTDTITVLMMLMVGLLVLLFVAREMSIVEEKSAAFDLPTTSVVAPKKARGNKRATD